MIEKYLDRIRNCKEQFESREVENEELIEGFSPRQFVFIKKLTEKIIKENNLKFGIYGTGEHTKKLLHYLKKEGIDANRIKCIIDYKSKEATISEIPIYQLEEAIQKFDLDEIIISSYTYEDIIFDRIRDMCPLEINIIKIYDTIIYDAEERVYFDDDKELDIKAKDFLWRTYSSHLNRYYFALAFGRDKVVLDIACGSGYGSNILSSKAKKVIGVDISEDAIFYANKHYKKENLQYIKMPIEALKLDDKVDVIISFETIEHIKNEKAYFEAIEELLSEKGIFIVSTPLAEIDGQSKSNLYHVNEFTMDRFKKTLEEKFSDVIYYRQDPENEGAIAIDDGKMINGTYGISYIIAVCYRN